jgi:hypothetical protein
MVGVRSVYLGRPRITPYIERAGSGRYGAFSSPASRPEERPRNREYRAPGRLSSRLLPAGACALVGYSVGCSCRSWRTPSPTSTISEPLRYPHSAKPMPTRTRKLCGWTCYGPRRYRSLTPCGVSLNPKGTGTLFRSITSSALRSGASQYAVIQAMAHPG